MDRTATIQRGRDGDIKTGIRITKADEPGAFYFSNGHDFIWLSHEGIEKALTFIKAWRRQEGIKED